MKNEEGRANATITLCLCVRTDLCCACMWRTLLSEGDIVGRQTNVDPGTDYARHHWDVKAMESLTWGLHTCVGPGTLSELSPGP